jgi:hypothetical protein
MPGTAIMTMKTGPKMLSRKPAIASGVKIPKLSFSPADSFAFDSHQCARFFDGVVKKRG